MSVRAKMSFGWTRGRGDKGAECQFTPVYDGDELKAATENAIFGKATPNGCLTLAGEFPVEKFQELQVEEFYIDMHEITARPSGIVVMRARKAYQSTPRPETSQVMTDFRFVSVEPNLFADLRLGITNPAASSWLADRDEILVCITPAVGRRSDQEIELRRAMLVKSDAERVQWNKSRLDAMTPEERAAQMLEWSWRDRFMLFRALGNEGPMPKDWTEAAS